jgi:hypothetical protein
MLDQNFELSSEESVKSIVIVENYLSVALVKIDENSHGIINQSISSDIAKKLSDDLVKELHENLTNNPNIQKINLEGLECSDKHLESLAPHLENLRDLTTLSLTNNKIELSKTPDFVKILKNIPAFKEIDFSGNPISSRGLEVLSDLLQSNPSIESLYLRNIKIDDEKSQILSQNLKKNSTLKNLDLQYNHHLNDNYFNEMLKYNTTILNIKIPNFQSRANQNSFIEKLNRNKKIDIFINENSSIFDEKILAKAINASVKIHEGVATEPDFLLLHESLNNPDFFKNPLNQEEAKEKLFQFYRAIKIDENSIKTIENLALDKDHRPQKPQNKIPTSTLRKMLGSCFGGRGNSQS